MPVLVRKSLWWRSCLDWLLEGVCRGPHGEIAGWVTDGCPAFWYPEVGGYYLVFCAYLSQVFRDPRYFLKGLDCLDWLASSVGPTGGVGKEEVEYVFDTAMVLRGVSLAASQKISLLSKMSEFCLGNIREGRAGTAFSAHGSRWSQGVGGHLFKAAAVLERFSGFRCWDMISTQVRRAGTEDSYLHAYCYGLEGMLLQGERAGGNCSILEGAEVLSRAQAREGGLPSHFPGSGFPLRSDVTAQAVRIWCLVDPERYRKHIRGALEFLRGLVSPEGGLWYEPDSPCVNVWSTIFAIQADLWACEGRGEVEWLI